MPDLLLAANVLHAHTTSGRLLVDTMLLGFAMMSHILLLRLRR